jgi:hypothetical protein
VTPHVPRARRSDRRQAVLACAYSAYLVAFVGGLLALASLVAPTGAAAVGAFLLAGLLVAAGGALWAVDAAESRRQPLAKVALFGSGAAGAIRSAR